MIKLSIKPYCFDCLEFEPEITERPVVAENGVGDTIMFGDTWVGCKYRERCKQIAKHIKSHDT